MALRKRRCVGLAGGLFGLLVLIAGQAGAAAGFKAATPVKGSIECPRHSSYDADSGECWRCPAGHVRTAEPLQSDKACEKAATTTFAHATDRGAPKVSGPGEPARCAGSEFLDREVGRCFRCPSDYQRTKERVQGEQACARTVPAKWVRARSAGEPSCPAGGFFDAAHGGSCWSCPAGTQRSAFPVDGDKACE